MGKYASTQFALPTKINRLGQNENYVFMFGLCAKFNRSRIFQNFTLASTR